MSVINRMQGRHAHGEAAALRNAVIS